MKRICFLLAIIITGSFFFTSNKIASEIEKTFYIEMNGVVKQFLYNGWSAETTIDSAKITVYEGTKNVVATYYSNKEGKCNFKIPLFKNVVIKISKDNYVMKTITINTWVPYKKGLLYKLQYDIYLFEKIDAIDVSILSKPIAYVRFDNTINTFGYNRNYSDKVNKDLQQLYWEYYNNPNN